MKRQTRDGKSFEHGGHGGRRGKLQNQKPEDGWMDRTDCSDRCEFVNGGAKVKAKAKARTKALNTEDTEGAEVNPKTKSQKMDGSIDRI